MSRTEMSTENKRRSEAEHIQHYDSADIDERHGSVPRWLIGVYIALGIWMIYYLIQYWRP
jgi:hypothetical protein